MRWSPLLATVWKSACLAESEPQSTVKVLSTVRLLKAGTIPAQLQPSCRAGADVT